MKITVENLPDVKLVSSCIYLPPSHPLCNKWLRVKGGDKICFPGVYFVKGSERVQNLGLSGSQRNYLMVKEGEQVDIEEVNPITLPECHVNFIVTKRGVSSYVADDTILVKGLTVVNINEMLTLLTVHGDSSSYINIMCSSEFSKDKQPVRVKSFTLSSVNNILLSVGDERTTLIQSHQQPTINTTTFQTINFEKLEVGGLSSQFEIIFRRIFLPYVLGEKGKEYGLKPTKGVILWGPPGTGKTALSRSLSKLLNVDDSLVKIINGAEVMSKWVGQSDENVRNLFEPARKNPNKLHVYVFDEFDALARKRGSQSREINDGVLNTLLTMIDGHDALNNIIVFGLTNRKDILDDAVLRPGRFDVHLYIGLPDQKGREEIFTIHSRDLVKNNHLDPTIIPTVTRKMANFTGAEIESTIKNVKTLVLRRHIDINDISKSAESIPKDLKFTLTDFDLALSEIQPMFGSRYYEVPEDIHPEKVEIYSKLKDSFTVNGRRNLLLCGRTKVGKTVMGKRILNDYMGEYKYYLGGRDVLGETKERVDMLRKVFTTDTQGGLIIIDNVEILLSLTYNHYDHQVLQTLMLLLNEKRHNTLLLVSRLKDIETVGLLDEIDSTFTLS